MTRKLVEVRKRTLVLWCGLGIVLVQLGLAFLVDQALPDVRDPEYRVVERLVRERRAQFPDRPLALALGSSRTLMGLDAGGVTRARTDGPLVVNAAFYGAGPMMHKVLLGRLLAAGIRPDFLFVEAMPMSFSAPEGRALEERTIAHSRFAAGEVLDIWPSLDAPLRFFRHLGLARLFPCGQHQVELREAVGIDRPTSWSPGTCGNKDAYGWAPLRNALTTAEIEQRTGAALMQYDTTLKNPTLSKGAIRAYGELFRFIGTQGIAATIVCPPESSRFRDLDANGSKLLMSEVRRIAAEFGLPVVDARDWVGDDGFWDGHHLNADGARRYSTHFALEVLPLAPTTTASPVEALPVARTRP